MSTLVRGGEIRRFKAKGDGVAVTLIEFYVAEQWGDSSDPDFPQRQQVASDFQTIDGHSAKQIAGSDEYQIRGLRNVIVKEVPASS